MARSLLAPEGDLQSPSFALDGGEEPEIVGVYVIDGAGKPVRVGFALGNEFSDHITERQNYLWLAHSKLRPASFGPGVACRRSPRGRTGRLAHPARERGDLGEAVPLRGTKYGALDRQSRGASFQICALPPARRCPHPLLRHSDSFVQRERPDAEGRHFEIESEEFGLPLRNRMSAEKASGVKGAGTCNKKAVAKGDAFPTGGGSIPVASTRPRCLRVLAATTRFGGGGAAHLLRARYPRRGRAKANQALAFPERLPPRSRASRRRSSLKEERSAGGDCSISPTGVSSARRPLGRFNRLGA